MEKKDLNMAYIYIMSIFAIGVVMSNIIVFFGGVGFAFVGASVLLVLATIKVLSKLDKKRFIDIMVLVIIEFVMFVILFFAYDFNINGITNIFPMVMRNVCAIYSIFALGYIAFRYFSEIKDKKYKVIEFILGNYTPAKKEGKIRPTKEMIKKNRELENGTLEPKPITMQSNIAQVNHQQSGAINVNNVQPAGSQTNQTQQVANNDSKPSVMDAVKNHPSYWE